MVECFDCAVLKVLRGILYDPIYCQRLSMETACLDA